MKPVRFVNIRASDVTGAPIPSKSLSVDWLRRSVNRILRDNVLCSIASITSDNRAHINTAYFCCSEELEFYFLSHPGSLHCRNILTNSSVGMTIFSSSQLWTDPGRGLQLFGTCIQLKGSRTTKAEIMYAKRFPAFKHWRENLGKDDVAYDYRFFQILSTKIKVHDEKTFGDGVFVLADIKRI